MILSQDICNWRLCCDTGGPKVFRGGEMMVTFTQNTLKNVKIADFGEFFHLYFKTFSIQVIHAH